LVTRPREQVAQAGEIVGRHDDIEAEAHLSLAQQRGFCCEQREMHGHGVIQ
jgi:hypothetical protein